MPDEKYRMRDYSSLLPALKKNEAGVAYNAITSAWCRLETVSSLWDQAKIAN